MRKLLITSLLCISTISLVSCSDSVSYQKNNTTRGDSSRAVTDDVRVLEGDYFDSSFELLSYEEIDTVVSIYIIRDKETKKEYIITKNNSSGGVSIIERVK